MMTDWRPSTWGEEISLDYGKAIRGYQDAVGQYRVFGTNGPVGWTDAALADGPGVVLGRKGAYRGVHFSEDPFWVIDTAYYVRPLHDELDMRWLYYAIQYHKLGEIDDGSPIPSTTRAAVYVRDIYVPSLTEQRVIAKCLSVYEDKIELNRRMNETLEAMARAVFKDWFVDFGPTRRKTAGETDPAAILGGLLPDPTKAAPLAALFPDSFGEDGLPEGWSLERVDQHLELAYGKALTKKNRIEGDYPVYGSGGISGTHNSPLESGPAIIVGRKGTVGSLYWEERDFYAIDTVFYVVPKTQLSFLYYLLQTLGLEHMNTDAAVPGLNRNNVYRLERPFGCENTRETFANLVDQFRALIRSNEQENQTLAATRDLLLPKLMSGEIRLKDTEDAA